MLTCSAVKAYAVLAALIFARAAAAQAGLSDEERNQLARKHFTIGREQYEVGAWKEAAREFELGFQYSPQPLFLYNIGQSARRSGEVDKAIDAYRRYLQAAPDASERAEVEHYLRELELAQRTRPPPPPPRSHKKLWLGLGVAAGAAAVLAASITLGVVLGTPKGPPSTDLGNHPIFGPSP
jgi:tetratricopeptide (TPR) repeat protein